MQRSAFLAGHTSSVPRETFFIYTYMIYGVSRETNPKSVEFSILHRGDV